MRSIRRSIALPPKLVEEALNQAPEYIRGNFNRLVILSLQQYIASRKAIAIAEEFMPAGMDGL